MRYFNLARLAFFVAALSLFLFRPANTRAEDQQGTATTDQTENEQPAREAPNFFPSGTLAPPPNGTPAPAPAPQTSSTPSPVAGENRESGENHKLGVGLFSRLPFQVNSSLRGGYDDNVLTTQVRGAASSFISPNIEIDYKFDDPRTIMVLQLIAGLTYYFDRSEFPTTQSPFGNQAVPDLPDYDVNVSLGLTLSHKVSARLTLGGATNLSYRTEPDFSANIGNNRRTGNYFYNADRVFAMFQWLPRFATQTSYNLAIVHYDDSVFGAFSDRAEHTLGNEFRFLLWPTTTVIAEGRLLFVSYDENSLNRDSMTEILLGGIEHKFSPLFSVGGRGGAQFRSYDNGIDKTEPYFETTANYVAGKKTTLSWFTRYSLEEPSVAGSATVTTFRTGLVTKYEIAPRISTLVGFYYVRDDYPEGPRPPRPLPFLPRPPKTPAITEDSVDFNLSLRYELNRSLSADIGYSHTEVISNESAREYSRNRYFGGISFAF